MGNFRQKNEKVKNVKSQNANNWNTCIQAKGA